MPPSTFPDSNQSDELDSHYQYVKQRILAVNSSRLFKGIAEARDWPYQEAVEQAFHLIIEKARPSTNVKSWHSPLYVHYVQWAWIIIGSDIAAGQQGANRGDKYRINKLMQQELIKGLWAGFCEKQKWAAAPNNTDGGAIMQATSYVPSEKVWWTKPSFADKIDRNTGVLFSYASVQISAFAPAIDN